MNIGPRKEALDTVRYLDHSGQDDLGPPAAAGRRNDGAKLQHCRGPWCPTKHTQAGMLATSLIGFAPDFSVSCRVHAIAVMPSLHTARISLRTKLHIMTHGQHEAVESPMLPVPETPITWFALCMRPSLFDWLFTRMVGCGV